MSEFWMIYLLFALLTVKKKFYYDIINYSFTFSEAVLFILLKTFILENVFGFWIVWSLEYNVWEPDSFTADEFLSLKQTFVIILNSNIN